MKITYQPEQHSPTADTIKESGTIEQWRAFIAERCQGNPVLVFALCSAFAAPLLKFADQESGGFHLYGASSTGKTTALQVAASVWGSGADPGFSDHSYIGRWNTTGNALEATAAAHNDGLLCLDEIGSCEVRDYGKVIYNLFGGVGKSRMTKNITLRASITWRILALSTGEISGRRKIEDEEHRTQKTGQGVRILDIPVGARVVSECHGSSAVEYVNRLKSDCGKLYGTSGPAFIREFLRLEHDGSNLRALVRNRLEACEGTLVERLADNRVESFQRRALRRFALVLLAGQMASKFGILPVRQEELSNSIAFVQNAWIGDSENLPEGARGVLAIRQFINSQQGRFLDVDGRPQKDISIRDAAGYYNNSRDLYLFDDDQFHLACAGHAEAEVLRELRRRGLLLVNDGKAGRRKSQHNVRIHGADRKMRLIAVTARILESE